MSKPKWEKAPEWARVIVQQGVKKPHYCCPADHEDGARALWVSDTGRKEMEFELEKNCWEFTETRP
jgi:hypothetical protein